jgi:hypothetical protein
MNLVFWLLAGELVLLAVGISAGLFFINKRREHHLYESVTQLLQAILDSEPRHLEQMRDELLSLYPLSGKNKVDKLTQQIVEGEREFFRELIRILLVEDTRALPGLHQTLQGLMTRQREMLQQLGTGAVSLNPGGAVPPSGDGNSLQAVAQGNPDEAEPALSVTPAVSDEAGSGDDDDLDALLQAVALGDLDEDTPLVAGGDDEEEMAIPAPVSTPAVAPMTTGAAAATPAEAEATPAEDEDDDDDLDALLQAALGNLDDDIPLVAGGDDEEEMAIPAPVSTPAVAPMTTGAAAATPAEAEAEATPAEDDDDDLDALLQAALGNLDDDIPLVAGGDDTDETTEIVPVDEVKTDHTWSARSLLDDSVMADDDDLNALLQATALGDFDEDALLIDGNDEEEGTQEPEVPAPGQPAVPDEFDAILADMSRLDTAQSTPSPTGDDDLALDIEDILNDLDLAESPAAEAGKTRQSKV